MGEGQRVKHWTHQGIPHTMSYVWCGDMSYIRSPEVQLCNRCGPQVCEWLWSDVHPKIRDPQAQLSDPYMCVVCYMCGDVVWCVYGCV